MKFKVIDKRTGKEPIFDGNHLFKERWFKNSNLIYCDISGWAIDEDGNLMLVDDCNNVAYPPQDRFEVIFEDIYPTAYWELVENTIYFCTKCRHSEGRPRNFCCDCGCKMLGVKNDTSD